MREFTKKLKLAQQAFAHAYRHNVCKSVKKDDANKFVVENICRAVQLRHRRDTRMNKKFPTGLLQKSLTK